jgi:hypothetical protein
MTYEITSLICDAPFCVERPTHRIRYRHTLDGEDETTFDKLVCDRHAAELKAMHLAHWNARAASLADA